MNEDAPSERPCLSLSVCLPLSLSLLSPLYPPTFSLTANPSARRSFIQGADDGFREYKSMSQTFFAPVEERVVCPISSEAYFHGTWGGPVQLDVRCGRTAGSRRPLAHPPA